MKRLNKFHSLLQEEMPEFKVDYKTESTLMKFIGYVLFFNRTFMTDFTTTLGQTVYFPDRESVAEHELGYMSTLAHEYVHAQDAKRITNLLFGFLYGIPAILAPLMWFFAFYHWGLALALFLLFLVPLPAPWRAHYELRGYAMSLFMRNEILKERNIPLEGRREVLTELVQHYNKHFTGANYYFMWPFGMEGKLTEKMELVLNERILMEDEIFGEVAHAFAASKK